MSNHQTSPKDMSDKQLMKSLLMQAAFALLPLEKWGKIFRSRKVDECIRKYKQDQDFIWMKLYAFTVWFTTLREFLALRERRKSLLNELEKRRIPDLGIEIKLSHLDDKFCDILSLFTKEEQIHLNDRRLQLVHGYLSIFEHEDKITCKWFDSSAHSTRKACVCREEYRDIQNRFSGEQAYCNLFLKLDPSKEMNELARYYLNDFNMKHVKEIGQQWGIMR